MTTTWPGAGMGSSKKKNKTTKSKKSPKGTSRPGYTKETSKSSAQKDFEKKYTSKSPSSPLKERSERKNTARELDAMINRGSPHGGGADFGTIPASTIGVPRPTGMPAHLTHTPSAGFGGAPASTVGARGISDVQDLFPILGETPPLPDEDDKPPKGETEEEKKLRLQEEERLRLQKQDEKDAKDKSITTAKGLTEWWSKNGKGYRKYGDRKNIFTGSTNSMDVVSAKIADKLSKGYYKIVNQKIKLKDGRTVDAPMLIHASTGTPVNPYTGGIFSTETGQDKGGGYQNRAADSLGIDSSHAGVFSKEYQTGNGLSVSEMKPEHALRFLMKKNPEAFEQFFLDSKKKGINPFSANTIGLSMGAIMNMITGPEALQVGNNLERAGWGKAIKNEDGDYTIKLTEHGANSWAESFKVPDYVSSEAITKDREKGWLSEILGTKKFSEAPIELSNLIDQKGYAERTDLVNPMYNPTDPMSPNFNPNLGSPDFVDPIQPQQVDYGWVPPTDLRPAEGVTGTPSGWVDPTGGSVTNYPQFTPEGYNIGAYNPSRDYSGGTGQTRTGDGVDGESTPDPTDPTDYPYGNLTFDVHGRPIKKYDYTGREQLHLGGGWKKDGQYIGSPWGTHHFKSGGIANFKPYGY